MTTISCYHYFYGAGMIPNRKIEFRRNESNELEAIVTGIFKNESKVISVLSGKEISVELHSTSEKLEILKDAQEKHISPKFDNDKIMTEFTVQEQDDILTHLVPVGEWRICMTFDIDRGQYFAEKVTEMRLYRV